LRWLWGFFPLALVAIVSLLSERGDVEKGLRESSLDALKSAGIDWAQTSFTGRDAVITGNAADEAERAAAIETVRKVWGVRAVANDTTLVEAVRPYVWLATRDGSQVHTEGNAPTIGDRNAVLAILRTTFKGVEGSLKLARGAPPREPWLGAISFASNELSLMSRGEVRLDDMGLSITGEAATPAAFANIEQALKSQLPKAVVLVKNEVTPPAVQPYVFAASRQGSGLVLEGFAPDEATRARIVEEAHSQFHGGVSDHLAIGAGAPKGWQSVAVKSIEALGRLDEGEARLKDYSAEIRGVAIEQDTADAVAQTFHRSLPEGYHDVETISYRKARIPLIKPYVWSARLSGKELVLEGNVPGEDMRRQILGSSPTRLPGIHVTDQMSIGAGSPERWAGAAAVALDELGKLDTGVVELTDNKLSLIGHARDKATADEFRSKLAQALPFGFVGEVRSLTFDVPRTLPTPQPQPPAAPQVQPQTNVQTQPQTQTLPTQATAAPAQPQPPKLPLVSPYVWSAELANGTLTLDGSVPNREARAQVLNLASQRVPWSRITDNMALSDGMPPTQSDWLKSVDAGFKALGELGAGRARLIDRHLAITGRTSIQGLAERISDWLKTSVPRTYYANADIAYATPAPAPPPEPPPEQYTTKFGYDGLNVSLEGRVPDEASHAKLLAQIKEAFPDRNVVDHLTVGAGAPTEWLSAALAGISQLSALTAGQLTLRDKHVFLSGTTESEQVLRDARRVMSTGLPKPFEGAEQLTYVAPPAPDPNFVAHRKEDDKYDVGKLIQEASPLKGPECQAVLNSVARGKVFFASGRANLTPRGAATLATLVSVAKRCPDFNVEISGHTDSDGSPIFNQHLSEQRAQAVANFLMSKGIEATRLKAVGYGETKPLAPNTNWRNKALNRRIEFDVTTG
jgi:outer membrane protein OmpA-like peptidoglycan-associated protein